MAEPRAITAIPLHFAPPKARSSLPIARHHSAGAFSHGRPTTKPRRGTEKGWVQGAAGCAVPRWARAQALGAGAPAAAAAARPFSLASQHISPCSAVRTPKEPQDEIMRHTVQAKVRKKTFNSPPPDA